MTNTQVRNRITIRRAPSLDSVMTCLGKVARHEHFGERMNGEEGQRVAAVLYAANYALRRDVLGKSWRGHRHTAAKCGEIFDRLMSDPSIGCSNQPIEVDIAFA